MVASDAKEEELVRLGWVVWFGLVWFGFGQGEGRGAGRVGVSCGYGAVWGSEYVIFWQFGRMRISFVGEG